MARRASATSAAQRLGDLVGAARADAPRLLLWPEAAVTEPLEDERRAARASARRSSSAARAAAHARPRRPPAHRRHRAHVRATAARVDGATNSVFALGPGGRIARPLRQGASRALWRISADAAAAVGDRPVAAGARRPRLRRRARARARSTLPGCGRVGLPALLRDHLLGRGGRPRATARTSSSIRRTTPGSARWGPPQHLAQARLRAAEEGLPVIRATPTGISAVIDARRRVCSTACRGATAGVIDARPAAAAARRRLFAALRQRHPAAARLRCC